MIDDNEESDVLARSTYLLGDRRAFLQGVAVKVTYGMGLGGEGDECQAFRGRSPRYHGWTCVFCYA